MHSSTYLRIKAPFPESIQNKHFLGEKPTFEPNHYSNQFFCLKK